MARRNKTIGRSTRFAPTFESLEPRQLLAANVLAGGLLQDINLNTPGDVHSLQLDISGTQTVTLALEMKGENGLNPGSIVIESVSGHTIAPITSSNGSTSSMILVELGPGSYEITTQADSGTTGRYDFSVSLVGDMDETGSDAGNGRVTTFEQMWAQAAMAQSKGLLNGYTATYYAQFGIPVGSNLYDLNLDANRNGIIDATDCASVASNAGKASFTIELTNDSQAPVITADLLDDTGPSDTDGISTDITVQGNVIDAAGSEIVMFKASIDSTAAGSYVDILAEIGTNGSFTLTRTKLEALKGSSLDDGQSHILRFIAKDEYDNESVQAYVVNFTLDLIAPVAPGTPDLTTASDLGYSSTDNLTADNTPTFTITTEANATVKLYSDVTGGLIGQAVADAGGVATITSIALADGTHSITAIATDLAGNVGPVSAGLAITVNTTLPIVPVHDLATASDTGTVGDKKTALTSVTIEGTTDPNTQVTLVDTGVTVTSDATGKFSFPDVPLAFGENSLTVRAMSASGAVSESTITYIQNNAPTAVEITPVLLDENDGQVTIAQLSNIFSDVNLASGDTLTYTITSTLPAWLSDVSISGDSLSVTTEGEFFGTGTITIEAKDKYNESVVGTVTLTVSPENDEPTFSAVSPFISGFKDEASVIESLSAHFADEETPSSELTLSVASATNGTAVLVGDELTFTPATGFVGTATVVIDVTDKAFEGIPANTVQKTLFFIIADKNYPVKANDVSTSVNEDNTSNTQITSAVATDKETTLADLTFEIVSGTSLGNGKFQITGGVVEIVTTGGDRYFRFTPNENYFGVTSFDYKVTDQPVAPDPATSDTGTVTIVVNPINDGPVATDDGGLSGTGFGVNENASVSGNVLTNDTDVENDTLVVTSLNVTSNKNIPVTISADGTFTYNLTSSTVFDYLAAGESTTDYFTYTISDGNGGTATAKVTLLIGGINDTPTANDDTGVSLNANASVSGNVLTNDTDPDTTDVLLVSNLNITSNKGVPVTITQNGAFTYNLTNSTVFDALDQGESDTDSFSYTITDSKGGTATATVSLTIHGVNDPPVATPDTATVSENGSITAINVLTNDSDPEGDTFAITPGVVTSSKGIAVTINADGTFLYNLTGSTVFDYLKPGQTATDTFTYTISDANGSSVGTVTVTITGENDAPVGVIEDTSTNKNTAIDINVLANDTDVDSTGLVVSNLPATSSRGASLSINADGTVKYDPTGSAELQAIPVGQTLTDTFTYKASDGSLTSDTVIVTIVVSGFQNTAPHVIGTGLPDISLEDGDPQPSVIDLTSYFGDVDGHNLSFSAVSSNTELVTVTVNNTTKQLTVTYLDYATGQNRTPAQITVTATETDSGEALSVSDQFTVTITPIQTTYFYLVARDTATDTTTAQMTTSLPTAISSVEVGSSYVVEIWVMNTYPDTATAVAGALGDLGFDNDFGTASSLSHDGPFSAATQGTIDNTLGEVSDFGGANLANQIGLTPYYSRLGYVVFTATAAGSQVFSYDVDMVSMLGGGGEPLDPSQINVTETTVTHTVAQDAYTFAATNSTSVSVSGTIGGTSMTPNPPDANVSSQVVGTQVIAIDDYDDPSSIMFMPGLCSLDPSSDLLPLYPGIGGADNTAEGEFALSNSSISLAIRDVALSLSSGTLSLAVGDRFSASSIDVVFSSGTIDYRTASGVSGTIDLTTRSVSVQTGKNGYLVEISGDGRRIDYSCDYTVDLSDIFGANSFIVFSLLFESTYGVAPIMGTAAAEDTPTDIALSIVKDPTMTDAKSEVSSLPESETWIHEWDSHWVEVWVKTEEGSGVSSANVDLTYNPDYFTATEIEYSPAVIGDFSGDILTDGLVSGFGGTLAAGAGVDGYVLLGRVKFESLANDGIALDVESFGNKPLDLGLTLTVNDLIVDGTSEATVGLERIPNTELWAMPYDINDDNTIDLRDVLRFTSMFGTQVLDSGSALAQVVDYDNNGTVNLSDMLYMLSNFQTTKGSGLEVAFPENFTQRWIGSGLDTTGNSSAGELLDAATALWQDLLGSDMPIDIQLVVTDLGGKQLAEAQILATDEEGKPIAGRITLDDDAAGLGWYSQLDGTPDAGMYDLYTVMLHEIGHTLGFLGSYDGFGSYLQNVGGTVTFVDESLSVTMDASGNHVADADLSGDLMSSTLDPGVRKLPSTLDAQMILAAYEAAQNGASGYAAISAAVTANATADSATSASAAFDLQASSLFQASSLLTVLSTSDFGRLENNSLVGDMTWARLLESRSKKNDETIEATDALFAYDSIETTATPVSQTKVSRNDSDSTEASTFDFADELLEAEAHSTTDTAIDTLFNNWDILGEI